MQNPAPASPADVPLKELRTIYVRQVHELGEWLGFETRNKYSILDDTLKPIAYAAEQQKGILGFLFRQYLGHWRKFDIHFFDMDRQVFLVGHHPFRILFQRLEVKNPRGRPRGAIQQRFSVVSKRFDVLNEYGKIIMTVSSPIWKPWTFTFLHNGLKKAEVKKKWAGILSEGFTDKDNFEVDFPDVDLPENERKIVMAAALFIDLNYFETKAR